MPKGLALVNGIRIADRALAALRGATDRQIVVANDPRAARWFPGLHTVRDAEEGLGPLHGLRTALASAEGAAVLVVAWDMPFVTAALLSALRAEGERGASAAVPVAGNPPRAEPLCAYYGAGAIAACDDLLARGERRAAALFESLPGSDDGGSGRARDARRSWPAAPERRHAGGSRRARRPASGRRGYRSTLRARPVIFRAWLSRARAGPSPLLDSCAHSLRRSSSSSPPAAAHASRLPRRSAGRCARARRAHRAARLHRLERRHGGVPQRTLGHPDRRSRSRRHALFAQRRQAVHAGVEPEDRHRRRGARAARRRVSLDDDALRARRDQERRAGRRSRRARRRRSLDQLAHAR